MYKGLFTKKNVIQITLLGFIFAASAVSADYSNSNNSYANTDSSAKASISDQELLEKIQNKISSGWFSKGFDGVTVSVNKGDVTLKGTVTTADRKEKVEKEVRNVDGVRSLKSEIAVQDGGSTVITKENEFPQDVSSSAQDDQLNKKIRDYVSKGWLWTSYKDVTLNTSNGIVTLQGTVESPKDQEKLMSEIQKIEGVKSVRSNLKFSNP